MIIEPDIDDIQQAYDEQKFIFNEIKTSIDCIREYCENTPEKSHIIGELSAALEYAYNVLMLRREALDKADQEYIRNQQAICAAETPQTPTL